MIKTTPMVQQYLSIKKKYPDAILFYRMGDFYEMFFEDAEIASRILEITLTSRNKKDQKQIPMCGIPHHAASGYIAKLVENGYKVAICEQIEDPRQAKGIVKRDVVRIITPNIKLETEMLDARTENFLLAISLPADIYGISYLDISTGMFRVTESDNFSNILDECRRIEPREVLLPQSKENHPRIKELLASLDKITTTFIEDAIFDTANARSRLIQQFKTVSLEGFGCEGMKAGISAAGALLYYIKETQKGEANHLSRIIAYSLSDYMIIDEITKRNLELFKTIREGSKRGSLFGVMDRTVTAMGGRLLRRWLQYPLLDKKKIDQRLDAVEEAKENLTLRRSLRESLDGIYDLERLNSRIVLAHSNARDLLALKRSLKRVPEIKNQLSSLKSEPFVKIYEGLDDLADISDLIERAICDDPPMTLREGGIIRPGYSQELDEIVEISKNGKEWISRLEKKEREATGINSLKVGFNKVFGYYIEVSKTHLKSVPDHYIRKQTLVGGERYITEDLKAYETKVLEAEERRSLLEYELFQTIRERVAQENLRIQHTASLLAKLDVLLSLAELADENDYVKPDVHNNGRIFLEEARHPVIEKLMSGERFIPNTIEMDNDSRQVLIITGPNMAGKSTLLRQVALIVLMAQIGSFVPARSASITLIDRIFTRVGALDNLSQGQSTFMVEMQETANILNTATDRSLVILDEIGRGTSTFDGLSIAWAVAEYLHDWKGKGIKTLFATHYHELTDLATTRPRVKNYNIAVKEWNDEIIFLRRLVEGGTNRSYGIQVARLAGIPKEVVERAKEVLRNIEEGELDSVGRPNLARSRNRKMAHDDSSVQLSLFKTPEQTVIETIKGLNISTMTPLEALNRLNELKELIQNGCEKI